MNDDFWINPLHLQIDSTDSEGGRTSECRRQRSADSDPNESIKSFLRNVVIASAQAQDVITHLIAIQHPHLDTGALESHGIDFLRVPENIIQDNETSLKEIYFYLQKFAVALYQMLEETQAIDLGNEYAEKLAVTKDKLVQMLSDLQLAIISIGMKPYRDITYNMLPPMMRFKSGPSMKGLHDYITMRDYAKFLQEIQSHEGTLLGN
ncbi:hypothetical protein CDAR_228621 [Caerostris darwini]|uniref:Uncharacterized protein n=1 Tax=Caerostris darwini TaxID=1538125 RepID=A0AAV4N3Z9_9ARAC|nr:hypothetical protein CDAR_228621 [Caerostris darwini]